MPYFEDNISTLAEYIAEGNTFYNTRKQKPYTNRELELLREHMGYDDFDEKLGEYLDSTKGIDELRNPTLESIRAISELSLQTGQFFNNAEVTDEQRIDVFLRMKGEFEKIEQSQVEIINQAFLSDIGLYNIPNKDIREFFRQPAESGCFGGSAGLWKDIALKIDTYQSLTEYQENLPSTPANRGP